MMKNGFQNGPQKNEKWSPWPPRAARGRLCHPPGSILKGSENRSFFERHPGGQKSIVVNFWPALGPKTGIATPASRLHLLPGGPPTPRAGKIERVYRLIDLPKEEDGILQRHGPKARRTFTSNHQKHVGIHWILLPYRC